MSRLEYIQLLETALANHRDPIQKTAVYQTLAVIKLMTDEEWAANEAAALAARRHTLAALWQRAMDNQISREDAKAIRRQCMAIAIADRGIDRVSPFPGWDA